MGLMNWLRSARARSSFKNETWRLWQELYGARSVKSGAKVNYATALEVTTVLRCAGVIVDSIATIPFKVFKKSAGGRAEATDHPLSELLGGMVNEWQNSIEFREMIGLHLALVRNAYVFPVRIGRDNRVAELIPFEPQWVTVKRERDYSLTYIVQPPGGDRQTFSQAQIWHLRAHPNWNGFFASSVVEMAREAVGLAMVTEEAHARLLANGAQVGGLYSVDGTLDKEQHKMLTEWLKEAIGGVEKNGIPLVLDRAAKFTATGMTGVDAQHLETRRFQIEEICRAMGVLPIMVGHYDKSATFASAEQFFLMHAVHGARPWHRRIEMSANTSLLTRAERREGYYTKFLDQELLRGAATTRADYYGKGIKDGWLTRNEAREFEELNPLPGLEVPLMPLNMTDGTEPPAPEPTPTPPAN